MNPIDQQVEEQPTASFATRNNLLVPAAPMDGRKTTYSSGSETSD